MLAWKPGGRKQDETSQSSLETFFGMKYSLICLSQMITYQGFQGVPCCRRRFFKYVLKYSGFQKATGTFVTPGNQFSSLFSKKIRPNRPKHLGTRATGGFPLKKSFEEGRKARY